MPALDEASYYLETMPDADLETIPDEPMHPLIL
jgi:hypothetical protein